MNAELKLITRFQKDNEWLNSNFSELQENYEERFIAIKAGKIIGSSTNSKKLIDLLRKKRENPAFILIKFIHEKGTSIII